ARPRSSRFPWPFEGTSGPTPLQVSWPDRVQRLGRQSGGDGSEGRRAEPESSTSACWAPLPPCPPTWGAGWRTGRSPPGAPTPGPPPESGSEGGWGDTKASPANGTFPALWTAPVREPRSTMSPRRSLAFRPTLPRVALLVWLLLAGEPEWAPTWTPEDGVSLMPNGWSRLGIELGGRDQPRRPGPPPPGWVGILIREAPLDPGWLVSDQHPSAWSLRNRIDDEGIRIDAQREPWHLLRFAVQGQSGDGAGRLGWSGELATQPAARDRLTVADESGARLLWLDLTGAERFFEYGLR